MNSIVFLLFCTDFTSPVVNHYIIVICNLQVIVLQSLDQRREILVVGNTHLYFHPNADHIRLLQAGTFIAFLQDIVQSVAKKASSLNNSNKLYGNKI